MLKIVEKARISDLHIHSCFSKHKNKSAVSENTFDNLSVLIEKLNENNVNICAITDHDVFSYTLYNELKKQEGIGSIERVLPGVEFSVMFSQESFRDEPVHVVAIFDDCDDEKVKKIESYLNLEIGPDISPQYDVQNNYSEEKFIATLRKIDLNVILIAHQKSSPNSINPGKNDLTRVKEKSDSLLFTCYFDALEFRNRNNEIFNKSFIKEKNLDEKIGFITGTDCHSWEDYPYMYKGDSVKKHDEAGHIFTYAKCLPTFNGLKMCFTDYSRFQFEDRFFSNSKKHLANLKISLDGEAFDVPLSKGINVIIGDNSVGKSFLLYEILGDTYKAKLRRDEKTGYKNYAIRHDVKIESQLDSSSIFLFDGQGEIRSKFENTLFKDDKFLSAFFDDSVNTEVHRTVLNNELTRLINTINESDKNKIVLNSLSLIDFSISQMGNTSFNLTELPRNRISNKNKFKRNFDWLELVLSMLKNKQELDFTEDELTKINKDIIPYFTKLKDKYSKLHFVEERLDSQYSLIQTKFSEARSDLSDAGSEYQSELNRINEEVSSVSTAIVDLIKYQKKTVPYAPLIDTLKIEPNVHKNNYYNFISTTTIKEISSAYFTSVYENIFKKGQVVNPTRTSLSEIQSNVAYLPEGITGIDFLKQKMSTRFEEDLKDKHIINSVTKEEDLLSELSAGMNQRNYFDIIAGEKNKKGIYLIDQPEDGVAQKAINTYVLKNFKEMSKNRQIIMITHNPQFIINLDVDNVIYLEKDDKTDNLSVKSGALEYSEDNYSILEIISENIEGGIEALRKRWKRYGKDY